MNVQGMNGRERLRHVKALTASALVEMGAIAAYIDGAETAGRGVDYWVLLGRRAENLRSIAQDAARVLVGDPCGGCF